MNLRSKHPGCYSPHVVGDKRITFLAETLSNCIFLPFIVLLPYPLPKKHMTDESVVRDTTDLIYR
jgi:hypothetical protein